MTRYDKYLWYVLRHRWFVFIECCKMGIPWQGLIHDLSKFRPSEFVPYARHFHGKGAKTWRDKTGYYKPTDTGDASFDYAWFLHQKRNAHHWQYWIFPDNSTAGILVQMPDKYIKEMVADWRGAGKAQHRPDCMAWYAANAEKMSMTRYTQLYVEYLLGIR